MWKYITYVKEEYCISGLKDYGFKFDEEKNIYKLSGIIVDSKTREVYCNGKCSSDELATLLKLFVICIINYKVCDKAKTKDDE